MIVMPPFGLISILCPRVLAEMLPEGDLVIKSSSGGYILPSGIFGGGGGDCLGIPLKSSSTSLSVFRTCCNPSSAFLALGEFPKRL
jgi:hypothetical protein